MTLYHYKALNTRGETLHGQMEAASDAEVVLRLQEQGHLPIEAKPAGEGGGEPVWRTLFKPKPFAGERLVQFTQQLATLLGAGQPLDRALGILLELPEDEGAKRTITDIRDAVRGGASLSTALERQHGMFSRLYINMVRAGEAGGFLDGALETIAQNFEKEVKLRSTIKSAMTYPVVVLVMALLGVLAMLIFIVPVFEKMFAGLGGDLPAPTMMLVYLSRAMVWVGPALVVAVIALAVWWRQNRNADAVRRRVDPIKLRLPVFGKMLKKIAIARFSRNLANMLRAGVPILQALGVVGDTSGNWVVEKALQDVAESVRRGRSIAQPLGASGVFPPMVVQMVAVGEDSGELEIMLEKIAQFYDDEVESTTAALTSLIEPLLIGFLGVVIGGMIIALYLPVFNIFNLIH